MALGSCTTMRSEKYYEKSVTIPAEATLEERVDMASRVVPSRQQLAWQNLGMTAFLHFGVNTFTNREWGDGTEDPKVFAPTDLNAEQWVSTLKAAGFNLVILTAKHHDGFCLWPSKATDHSVAASAWKDGNGDVVAELRKACDKYGMKLGLYLSPWDRNAPCYGDSEAYNDMFVAQLRELLGNYGKVDEVWFDGACGEGPNGKRQEYDWARFRKVMEELQPDAVLAITGDDVRWVGNEDGMGRTTEWSVTPLMPTIFPESTAANEKLGINVMSGDLGSRDLLAKAESLHWWPSEVDVSIRPGWFYHPDEQPKSLRELADIYLQSVGRNATLLLNIPPDRRGLIAANDSVRLMELGAWITKNFSTPAGLGSEKKPAEITFAAPTEINCVAAGEDISKGQRVEKFTVEGLVNGSWQQLAEGTTIGCRRILTFDPITVEGVRVLITESRGEPNINPVEAYRIVMPEPETANVSGIPAGHRAIDGVTVSLRGTDMQASLPTLMKVSGFIYTPHSDARQGTLYRYKCETSADGGEWSVPAGSGSEFGNIMHHAEPRTVIFDKPVDARFVQMHILEDATGSTTATPSWENFTVLTPEE
jgi:alpha-L-fucosidase